MIESVSTSFVQGASMRSSPQTGSAYAVSNAVSAASSADVPRYGTRLYVRLDSGAERAILEVRSSDTGDVVKQYPSEAQIRAFQRAASLKQQQSESQTAQQVAAQQARQQAAAEAAYRDASPQLVSTETAAPQQSAAPAKQSAPDLYQASAPRSSAPAASTPDISSGQSVSADRSSSASSPSQSILV